MPPTLLVSKSAEDTLKMGRLLGEIAAEGDLILLEGELGTGKTQLVKGIAAGLGISLPIISPTFVFLREYRGRIALFHLDLYRGTEEAYLEIGAPDFAGFSGLTVIEWGERVESFLKRSLLDFLVIELNEGSAADERIFSLRSEGARSKILGENWVNACPGL